MRTQLETYTQKVRFLGLAVVMAGLMIAPSVNAAAVKMAARVRMAITDASQGSVATNLGIYGGDNWDIAVDGDHVYTIASGVPNGFFYSTDAAATWQRPAGAYDYGSGRAVEVDPTSHAVYVALDGLYKSTDYGVTLTKIADNVGGPMLFAQGKLLAAYNDMAYVSADNGATFTSVSIATGNSISGFAASPTAGTFYAVMRNNSSGASSLYKSSDSGATWAAVTLGSGPSAFTEVSVKPTDANFLVLSNDNYLWRSMDAGVTWVSINTLASRPCSDFSVWTASGGRWYACAGYSENNGVSFTNFGDAKTTVMRGPGKIVVINAANESVLYGDCMSGVCKSTDGGLTWHNSLDGITGVNVQKISITTDKKTAWISSNNGLGKSTNFDSTAPTWTWPILPCDMAVRCDSSGIGESVWVKPDNADIVLAGSIGGYIYRSTDAGTTWTAQLPTPISNAKFGTGTPNNGRPQHFINDPVDPNIVYVAIVDPVDHIGAVLKSIDAGVTWTDLAITDDAPATILAMTNTGVLYAGTGEGKTITDHKGIYKYESGAWTLLTGIDTRLNITGLMVDPEVQTTVYASASNDIAPDQADGFFKSTDSGVTWTKIVPTGYLGFGAITVQKSTVPNTLYLAARDSVNHGVLLKSSDAGATWGALYTGLKSESFTTVVFDDLVAGNKHGVFSLKSRAGYSKLATTATKIKKGKTTTISAYLKDQTTKKLLKGSTVNLQKLVGHKWKIVGTVKTDKKAYFRFNLQPSATAKYRLQWKPSKTAAAEYTTATSKIITLTVKK